MLHILLSNKNKRDFWPTFTPKFLILECAMQGGVVEPQARQEGKEEGMEREGDRSGYKIGTSPC